MPFLLSVSSPPKSSGSLKWWIGILIILLLATVSASLGALTALLAPVEPEIIAKTLGPSHPQDLLHQYFPYTLSKPMNILVLGIDEVSGVPENSPDLFEGRSDTVLLVRFEPKTQMISVLSIPRDTQVNIPRSGQGKINEANYFGGAKLAKETVSKTFNGIPIHRYIRVSSGAFQELVDLLGGVEVFVSKPMSYVDRTQDLRIDLQPGWQTINGEQANQFARYRDPDYGDIGRVQRQQLLLDALKKRISNPMVIAQIPQMMRIMEKYVDTDLTFEEMLTLVGLGLQVPSDQIRQVMLPGRPSSAGEFFSSYWIIDPKAQNQVLYQYFNVDAVGFSIDNNMFQGNSLSNAPTLLNIAIQNVAGESEAGEKMAELLNKKGFKQFYLVDNPRFPKQYQTQIIVQQGDLVAAEALQKELGFGEIQATSTGEIGSDLTIRLGEDWRNHLPR